jgi:hypothetical protein
MRFNIVALMMIVLAFGCGQHWDGNGNDGGADSNPNFGDSGCGDGLKCQWTDCSKLGKPETTLTGTVYDPAGDKPLYDVYAYIPNGKPEPIAAGNPTCTPCEAAASGSPIVGALTGPDGKFTLTKGTAAYGVPSGDNIPIVVQAGKWRRQLVIPHVEACTNVDLDAVLNAGSGKARQLRLPANGSEGDMPMIAFTSGCDPAECFLRQIGIDDSEFAPPGTPGKHVHFYTGLHLDIITSNGPKVASTISGGNTPADTYAWWKDPANLSKYDIVFNACECGVVDGTKSNGGAIDPSAFNAMKSYLDGGGRLFATHFYYAWFAPPNGPSDFQGLASWNPGQASYPNYYIDSNPNFPKGQAFASWLLTNVGAPDVTGSVSTGVQIATPNSLHDVDSSGLPTFPGSTRWIYGAASPGTNGGPPASYGTTYLSFNTPTNVAPASQCGRAVFTDLHVGTGAAPGIGESNDKPFPQECTSAFANINEKALEFLFFDLSSCVQDDSQPPPTPN